MKTENSVDRQYGASRTGLKLEDNIIRKNGQQICMENDDS